MHLKRRFTDVISRRPFRWLAAGMALATCAVSSAAEPGKPAAAKVDFDREIRPILTGNCYKCHGPDDKARKAKLRFDIRSEALKPTKSGQIAIVPGAPDKSEMIARITAPDPDDVMPPEKTGKKLTPAQIETLRRWVAQGAPFAPHWAYVRPVNAPPPEVKMKGWPRNPVDQFILARLEREGLVPSPEADRYALVRRVSMDLTGLPPTIDEVDRFVNDRGPRAYEELVDRLLNKKAFGEHWARFWLDLARYADSAGYADDPLRTIWLYRDYVVRSFNNNKPFDRFTVEQIAGDLLPDPDDDDLIATAFHRNTMTNNEGGTDDEEFRNAAVIDRVNTTMAVWMATTMGCAQCHNHKYDPITQKDYFRLFAILNNTEDADRNDEAPVLKYFTKEQKARKKEITDEITVLRAKLKTPTPALLAHQAEWERSFPSSVTWLTPKPSALKTKSGAPIAQLDSGELLVKPGEKSDVYSLELPLPEGPFTGLRLEALPHESLPAHGPGNSTKGKFVISRVTATLLPSGTNRLAGRYVRIELPGEGKILSLAEVQVFHGEKNLALTGAASQSSTSFGGLAKLAIDDNTDGNFDGAKSTTHTETSDSPWWEVDLKSVEAIDRIKVWNRTDNDLESRLSDFRIVILDEKRDVIWEKSVASPPKPSATFALDNSVEIHFSTARADAEENGFEAKNVLRDTSEGKRGSKGWSPGGEGGQAHQLILASDKPVTVTAGTTLSLRIAQTSKSDVETLGCFRVSVSQADRLAEYASAPPAILAALAAPASQRTGEQQSALTAYYLEDVAPELRADWKQVAELKKKAEEVMPATVPIMRELGGDKRRKTHVQIRGNFKSLSDEVTAGLPAFIETGDEPAAPNRLDLARWLVDEKNPLTARVLANRLWEQIFGLGIVRTSGDFGSQGDRPTHPELLDWMAVDLIREKWNIKEFLKLLVTSATYRQSSRETAQLLERDPENLLLARGPRFRMSAEEVRDQALAVSGLLSPKMYGPSVRPPQPSAGLSAAFGGSLDWKTSAGEDRYRRAIYVEWRRTSPYPSMATFDAPSREVCTIRRPRSNTPLQALVTLNDPVYVEAAQALGERMERGKGGTRDKLQYGFRLCLARAPGQEESDRLTSFYEEALDVYAKDPAKAKELTKNAPGMAAEGANPAELAAWTMVGNVLLNLDETLMKR